MLGAAPLAAAPANDDFAAAQEIVVDQSLPVSVTGTTAGATVESAETALDPTLEATVWFRVVSPADGVVRIDTDGSDFQTRLAVAVGSGYGDLAFITADDDPSNGTRVIFEVANGVEYWIQVSGWNGEAGNLTLNLRETEGGSISGTVSAADDGAPLAGIAVRALAYRATFDRWWPVAETVTNRLGRYTLDGLEDGVPHRLRAVDASGARVSVYHPSAVFEDDAVAVVPDPDLFGADFPLVAAGSISGQVKETGGAGLGGMTVRAFLRNAIADEWVGVVSTTSETDGSYGLSGLPHGDVRVAFADFESGLRLPAFHGGGVDPELATPVVIAAGSLAVTGIDGSLERLGVTGVAVAPGLATLDFPGNPFAQYTVEASQDLESWETRGLPFHPESGPNSREVPAAGPREYWRLRGPSDLRLTPVPGIHQRTSYAQAQQVYRWVDRYVLDPRAFDFIAAFGYGDFDGDGKADALVFPGIAYTFDPYPCRLTRDIDGLAQDGAALFERGVAGGIHARKLLVGDLNSDAVDDAVLIDHGYDAPPFPGAPLRVLLSTPGGGIRTVVYPEHTGFHHAGALGDFDHDGDLDLFLPSPMDLGGVNLILANDGSGHFTPTTQLVGEVWSRNIWTSEFFDLDGDGFLDLAIGGAMGKDPAMVLWGTSRGTYGSAGLSLELPRGLEVYDYDAEDLDGDGDRDLLVTLAATDAGQHRFRLFVNHGGRNFVDETAARFDRSDYLGGWIDFSFVQDVDGDDDPDIVTDVRGAMLKWENLGDGHFKANHPGGG